MKGALYYQIMRNGIYWPGLLLFFLGIFPVGCRKPEAIDNSVSYHLGMAKAFYRQGKYWPAIEMYEKSLVMDTDCAEAYLQLGIIYDDNLKDKTRAVYCYHKFLDLSPDSEMSKMVREWIEKNEKITVSPAPASEILPPPTGDTPSSVPSPSYTPSTGKSVLTYRVKGGDTLAGLAGRFYENRQEWKKIYQANRDRLASPHQLKEGQELIIPPR